MGSTDSGATHERDPAEQAADEALSAFLDACADDPQAAPGPFAPQESRAAVRFWEAVEALGLLLPARPTVAAPPLQPGTKVGAYTILGEPRWGGMGVVYLAAQEHPRRTVALKLLRPGSCTAEALRRFEHEADTLGRLRHPGIAQIYDAGTADTGSGPQPYFAMEWVDGVSLTRYVVEHGLNPRDRIALLACVCDAVEHAHQKGVIHRDLKPGNILVGADQRPRILDFGVARVTDRDVQMTTLHTHTGELLGTVPYMSPEQVSGDPHEIDTRSDVYALGVIGYELLTGRLPYDLEHKPIFEAVRIIHDETPVPLSSISRVLRGDLETIVAKALEKDPTRRYQTANDLASDIRRYLTDEPIVARPPSATYQLRKLVSRHKVVSALVAAISLLVTGTAVAMGALYARAEAARRAENQAHALKEAADLWYLWDTASLTPASAPLSQEAEHEIEHALTDRGPEIEASTRLALGARHLASGELEAAEPQLRAALRLYRSLYADDHPAVVNSLYAVVNVLRNQRRWDEALELARTLLAEHPGTNARDCMTRVPAQLCLGLTFDQLGRYDEAVASDRQALDTCTRLLGQEHRAALRCTRHLVNSLIHSGSCEEAEALARSVVTAQRRQLGESAAAILVDRRDLAGLLWLRGECDQAAADFGDILQYERALRREDDPILVDAYNSVCVALRDAGRYDEAERYLRAVLGKPGSDGPTSPMLNLAKLLYFKGDIAEAETLLAQVLEARRAALPPEHVDIAEPMLWLGLIYVDQGELEQAEALLEGAWQLRSVKLSAEHWLVGEARNALGACRAAQGRYPEAEQFLLDGYRIVQRKLTDKSRMTQQCTERIVRLYERWGKTDTLAEWRDRLAKTGPTTAQALSAPPSAAPAP